MNTRCPENTCLRFWAVWTTDPEQYDSILYVHSVFNYLVEIKCTILMNLCFPHHLESLKKLLISLHQSVTKIQIRITNFFIHFLRAAIYKYVSQSICISFQIAYVNFISTRLGGADYAHSLALPHLECSVITLYY